MRQLTLRVDLQSPVLLGSGEGWGSLIDADIVYDEMGLPYLPARRLKGVLRESALEVVEMLNLAQWNFLSEEDVDGLFGVGTQAGRIKIANLQLEDSEAGTAWLRWAYGEFSDVFSIDETLASLTEIRRQTALDQEGVAEENSLRSMRVLKSVLRFMGKVWIEVAKEKELILLTLAVANLRAIGSKRNRGLGEVVCTLEEQGDVLTSWALAQLKGGMTDANP